MNPALVPLALAAAAGLVSAAAYFPFGLNGIILVSLAPAWLAAYRAGARRGALYVGLTGVIGCGAAFHWIVPLLMRFGHCSAPAAVAGFLLWLAWEALAMAVWGAVWGLRSGSAWLDPVRLAAPVLVEAYWPRLFPWHFGDPLAELPLLSQAAELGGVSLLSLLVLLADFAVFRLWLWSRGRTAFPRAAVLAAGLALAADAGYGAYKLVHPPAPDSRIEVALLHPAEPLRLRHAALDNQTLYARHRSFLLELAKGALKDGPVDLLVLPEAVLNAGLEGGPGGFAAEAGAPALYGARVRPADGGRPHYNSAVLEAGGRAQMYHKRKLMLLGEWIPYSDKSDWVRRHVRRSSLDRGEGPRTLGLGGAGLGPLICYEAILPSYVREYARQGAQVLVNVTEDGWYGWTGEPYQHLLLARLRAVENRRFLLRSVNNGITAVVDPLGRVAASDSDRSRPGWVRARIGLYSGLTPYARWGDWLLHALALAAVLCLAAERASGLQ